MVLLLEVLWPTVLLPTVLTSTFLVPSLASMIILDDHESITRSLQVGSSPDGAGDTTPIDSISDLFSDKVIAAMQKEFVGFLQAAVDQVTREVTGKDLTSTYNCNAMPLGANTKYKLLKFPDIFSFLGIDTGVMGGLFSFENGFDFGNVFEDLADGTVFPNGSDPADPCIPYTQEASQARATALGGGATAEGVRQCTTDGTGDPCCGASSCLPAVRNGVTLPYSECVGTCLEAGDECFSDSQCSCSNNNACVANPPEESATTADPSRFSGKCMPLEPQEVGLVPVCLAFNSDMFAIRFLPHLIPFWSQLPQKLPGIGSYYKSTKYARPCEWVDGYPLKKGGFPTKNLQITFQFIGIGLAWNSGTDDKPSMIYGTSSTTRGDSVNAPTIYDGLAQVPIVVPGINFWLSLNFRFINLDAHLWNVMTCLQGSDDVEVPKPSIPTKFAVEMVAELYINTSGGKGCVLLVAPTVVLKLSIIPVINIGSAIGGYCRLPGDRCTPDGFFLNVKVQPNFLNLNGIAEDVLSFGSAGETDVGSAGASVGIYIDKATGTPTGGLLKAFLESPKFMGISLTSGFGVEFQYISDEELERRRWTITADLPTDGSVPQARCPRYKNCKKWKPYKWVDAAGKEVVDADEKIRYPNQVICASVLEDNDPLDGVGDFNRQLLAKVPKNDKAEQEFRPSPSEWHVQDFFRGYDMFVVSFRLEGLSMGIIRLETLVFTLVIFGDIQPAVNPNEEFPDEASRAIACEAAAKNDDLYVYIETEALISVLMLVKFQGRLTIANIPVTQESGLAFDVENPNYWTLRALAKISIIGMETVVTASGEWFYTNENKRRRLLDGTDPCAKENRRRLESEGWRRALDDSVELTEAPIDVAVEMSCDSFADCMEDIGKFVAKQLTALYNELKRVVKEVLRIAEEVFTELASLVGGALDYLGLGFVADAFEELWEDVGETFNEAIADFDRIGADGFQFTDLVEVGIAILKGAVGLLEDAGKFVLGLIGIGIGTVRGNPRTLSKGMTSFGCEKFQNQVERCDFCIWGGCLGCDWENAGEVYVDQECLEQAASDAARGMEKKEELEEHSANKKIEEEQENKGFYTTFQEKCQNGGTAVDSSKCPVARPPFKVAQLVNKDGVPGSTEMRMSGSTLQKDSADTKQDNKKQKTGLDFQAQRPECDPESESFDESFLVTTQDGSTICKDVADNIDSWFNNTAKEEAVKFSQGSALGAGSAANKIYNTEALWSPPSIAFPNGMNSYELELDCTNKAIQKEEKATNDFLYQLSKMQAKALENPGVSVTLDPNLALARAAVVDQWETFDILQSCLKDVAMMNYRVIDDTGKQSNALMYQFTVSAVPPKIDLTGPKTIYLNCTAGDLNPYKDNAVTGPPPTVSGGCLSESYSQTVFVDQITTSLDLGKCLVPTILRKWLVRPPSNDEVKESDEEKFGNANCATDLAALVVPVSQTLNFDCEDEGGESDQLAIPLECSTSPLRFAGFEDLTTDGLPRIDILHNHLGSLHQDETLYDSASALPVKVVFAESDKKVKLKGRDLIEGSFVTFSKKGKTAASPLLESRFYVDYKRESIRHRQLMPQVLGEYTDLCQEGSIVGFKVSAGNKKEHFLCFEAVCGKDRAIEQRRILDPAEELRRLKEATITEPRPTREEIRAKLEAGPFVPRRQRENTKRFENLLKLRETAY